MLKNFTFTKRYSLGLFLIALLAILAYVNLNNLIKNQADDGKWIHISDHQRLLTQQIALYGIYYKTKELQEKINELQHAHILLIANAKNNKLLKKIYFEKPINLDKKIQNFLFHAKRFYENKDGRSLNYILSHSKTLLYDLEKVVNVYLDASKSSTKTLEKYEFYILILTLSTLIFEILFIFMPANRSINKKTKELKQGKDYLDAIIQSSTDAIISLDKDAQVRTFNKEAENIFGLDFQTVSKPNSLHFLFPEKQSFTNEKILKLLSKLSQKRKILEITLKRANNKTFDARLSFGKVVKNENIAIVLHVKDISKEKLKEKIVTFQGKFAALGEMIAIIAHQWRQPLAQLNFNHMYLRNKIHEKSLQDEIKKNEEIIAFMSETITNFEQFYKKTDDKIFNVNISINQALALVQGSIKQMKIEKQIQNNCYVYGNTNNLSQVLLSIFQNAVSIAYNRQVQNPTIKIKVKSDEKNVILSVKDNFGGIRIEPIEDIFKPLVSRKSSIGLGLYMSKLIIVEKFKGIIEAKNVGAGAEFSIIIKKA